MHNDHFGYVSRGRSIFILPAWLISKKKGDDDASFLNGWWEIFSGSFLVFLIQGIPFDWMCPKISDAFLKIASANTIGLLLVKTAPFFSHENREPNGRNRDFRVCEWRQCQLLTTIWLELETTTLTLQLTWRLLTPCKNKTAILRRQKSVKWWLCKVTEY